MPLYRDPSISARYLAVLAHRIVGGACASLILVFLIAGPCRVAMAQTNPPESLARQGGAVDEDEAAEADGGGERAAEEMEAAEEIEEEGDEEGDYALGEEDGESAEADIEEIRVTGQRGEALATETTVSAAVFDPSDLAAIGAQDISDIAQITPNLEINTISASAPTFFIRGVGLNDFASNATGAVAIYQNGVPINAPALQLGQLFDISGVQVLRGPQSWGDQRNASAGLIGFDARLPEGELESTLRVDVGNFGLKDFEGAVAAPLDGAGTFATRLAFRYSDRDPFYRNRCGGLLEPTPDACGSSGVVPPGLPKFVNSNKRWGLRGVLRIKPDANDMDWIINLHGGQIDQDSMLGQVIGTGPQATTTSGYVDPPIASIFDTFFEFFRSQGLRPNPARRAALEPTLEAVTNDIALTEPFENDYDLVGGEEVDSVGGSVRGEMLFGGISFETITGAESYERSRVTDFDFSSDRALHTDIADRAWQFTQSLEVGSELVSTPLEWKLGGFFLTEDLESNSFFLFDFRAGAPNPNRVFQDYEQTSYSFGLYGNMEWAFHEAFVLAGGARLNYDRKNFLIAPIRWNDALSDTGSASAADTWIAPTGGISLTYLFSDSISIYSMYNRGWKPGVFNSTILANLDSSDAQARPFVKPTDPEKLDSFEFGMKGAWLDQTLELRAAFFYYKYMDYQVFMLKARFGTIPQFEILNANDAQIYGAEADLYLRPLQGRVSETWEDLVLEVRFSWLESEFLDFTDTRTIKIGNNTVTETIDYTGNRLPNTPRYKLSGAASWTFALGRFGWLRPRYDVAYTDDIFFDPSEGVGTRLIAGDLPQYAVGQRSYTVHGMRLTWGLPGEQVEISGWVRNLTDERYKTYVADATRSIQSLLNWVGDPRTFGLSMKFDW